MDLPAPLSACPRAELARVSTLLFDVDDTLTVHGNLPKEAALALYKAKAFGLNLIAVTGRSASWAEMLFRLFPLAAAVGETGAMAFLPGADGFTEIFHAEPDAKKRAANFQKRKRAEAKVMSEVPGARLAVDNIGRVYDSAFDLVEDGPALDEDTAGAIREILREAGLTVAQSSVHINAWFGRFDKATMGLRVLEHLELELTSCAYIGDSANDQSMFDLVPLSVGVANVSGATPRFVTSASHGAGFAELVDAIVDGRG